MATETIYPKGVRIFAPHQNAPEFVKGQVIISLNELVQFCKDNPNLLSDYNGTKQLKLNLLSGEKGLYSVVDTFKPKSNPNEIKEKEGEDNLPF